MRHKSNGAAGMAGSVHRMRRATSGARAGASRLMLTITSDDTGIAAAISTATTTITVDCRIIAQIEFIIGCIALEYSEL